MGADAYILTVCDYRLAQELGILNYNESQYQPGGSFKVVCSFGHQCTTSGSRELAEAVGKDLYNVRDSRIEKTCHVNVECVDILKVQDITNRLVLAGQIVFLMPEF